MSTTPGRFNLIVRAGRQPPRRSIFPVRASCRGRPGETDRHQEGVIAPRWTSRGGCSFVRDRDRGLRSRDRLGGGGVVSGWSRTAPFAKRPIRIFGRRDPREDRRGATPLCARLDAPTVHDNGMARVVSVRSSGGRSPCHGRRGLVDHRFGGCFRPNRADDLRAAHAGVRSGEDRRGGGSGLSAQSRSALAEPGIPVRLWHSRRMLCAFSTGQCASSRVSSCQVRLPAPSHLTHVPTRLASDRGAPTDLWHLRLGTAVPPMRPGAVRGTPMAGGPIHFSVCWWTVVASTKRR